MSCTISARASLQILVLDSLGEADRYRGQYSQPGLSAEFTVVWAFDSIEDELRTRSYDLVLWRISAKQDLSVLQAFLQRDRSLPPLIVIAPQDGLSAATEETLLDLVGHGIRDFCFDNEPAVLRRAIRRITAEQTAYDRNPQGPEFMDTLEAMTAVVETCPLAVVVLTPEGIVLLWNRSAEKIYGWRRNEVVGKPLPTVPPGGEYEFRLLLEMQLHGISHYGKEVQRHRKDGTLVDVSLWTAPLRDRQGRIRAKLAISSDISERRRADQERLQLLEREAQARAQAMERFRELVESAPDAIIEVDGDGRIVLLNALTERLFGYAREELLGRSLDCLLPDEIQNRHAGCGAEYAANSVARPMVSGLELFGRRKDGTQFPVEISLSPVKSVKGVQVSAIVRDVTERKKIEGQIQELHEKFTQELSAANRELEARNNEIDRANRLKSDFLANMSHELRTPLHTIIGFAQVLTEEFEGPLNFKQKRFVDYIYRDSLHLLDLINGILDISKIEAGKLELNLENFNAVEALNEVVSSIAPLAGAKAILLDRPIGGPFAIHADRLRFKQILYNLLSNAIKFTPEKGKVAVGCSASDSTAQFYVSDTGMGISEKEHAAIFHKFYQIGAPARSVPEGTGLGLAITKHLVEQHGGRIWLESALGAGSSFYFSLPV